MAAVSSLLSEDQFLCSICLDVFTDPVTTPCGHNFCKACITKHWNNNVQRQCPLCKERCEKKPELRVNTVLSEMAAQFKQPKESSISSEEQNTNTGEVFCDFCTETKPKAFKSCLMCQTSFCETHLEPHHRLPGLKKHKLIDPIRNLESKMCKKHERPLEYFCKTDQICVCRFCTEYEHKLHRIVLLRDEYQEKKAELGETEAEVKKMIPERRMKIEEIRECMALSKEDADQDTATSVEVFSNLVQDVERSLAQLLDFILDKHKTTEKQAESFIEELEEEISELTKRSTELEQLSHSKDHLHFLQSYLSLDPAPATKDWTNVKAYSFQEHRKVLRTAVVQLEETLTKEVKKMCCNVELKTVQHFAVDVTLDPETAHAALIVSDDGKQVSHGSVEQNLPESPHRFLHYFSVLGKQGFSSGRFFYEVQVEGKTDWVLGVARESIDRRKTYSISPKNGLWTVWLVDGKVYKAYVDSPVLLYLKSKPQKVGVFVDYEEGLVCFYDVDASSLIYSFTGCKFTEKLYPIFSPKNNNAGKNSSPLIICSMDQTYTSQNSSLSSYGEACSISEEASGYLSDF